MATKKAARKKKPTAVAVAKDTLKLLAARKIKVNTGNYCVIPKSVVDAYEGESLKKVMRLPKYKPCTVCVIGSLLLGYVDKHNQLKVPSHNFLWNGYNDDVAVDKLRGVFTESQLRYMEVAFEGREVLTTDLSYAQLEAAMDFHDRYTNPTRRLKAILNNVIENKGKFVLPLTEEEVA